MERSYPNRMPGDVWTLLVAVGAIAILAGFMHSAIGFGFGIVAISLLPFVIDARSAHIVVSISSVPMLMMAAWTYREGVEKRSLSQALLGAAIFLPLGLWLFETVSLDLLVRGTGLGVFVMVLLSLRRPGSSPASASKGVACFAAGAISGFLAGAVSIAGPPIAAFALKQGWSQARYKAFVTQCLLVMSIYKAGLLYFRSHVDGPVGWQIVVAACLAIARRATRCDGKSRHLGRPFQTPGRDRTAGGFLHDDVARTEQACRSGIRNATSDDATTGS